MTEQRDAAAKWDDSAGFVARCGWCHEEVAFFRDVEKAAEAQRLHAESCPKHPISQWKSRAIAADRERDELKKALAPFAALIDRNWHEKEESIASVAAGGHVSEIKAVSLGDVLRAVKALSPQPKE